MFRGENAWRSTREAGAPASAVIDAQAAAAGAGAGHKAAQLAFGLEIPAGIGAGLERTPAAGSPAPMRVRAPQSVQATRATSQNASLQHAPSSMSVRMSASRSALTVWPVGLPDSHTPLGV